MLYLLACLLALMLAGLLACLLAGLLCLLCLAVLCFAPVYDFFICYLMSAAIQPQVSIIWGFKDPSTKYALALTQYALSTAKGRLFNAKYTYSGNQIVGNRFGPESGRHGSSGQTNEMVRCGTSVRSGTKTKHQTQQTNPRLQLHQELAQLLQNRLGGRPPALTRVTSTMQTIQTTMTVAIA